MSAAVSGFQDWRERRQARQDHDQLTNNADADEDEDEGVPGGESHPLQIPVGNGDHGTALVPDQDGAEESGDLSSPSSTTPMMESTNSSSRDIETGDAETEDNPTETTPAVAVVQPRTTARRNYTLADLEEEREMARRRTSFCVLFAVFILFRLWIQAVATGDFFLLMLCLMGTSWTARFLRHTREREEELDRMIANYNDGENGGPNSNEGLDRDLQRMSFQTQLAMAIINSQREMMQGGFGNPDGQSSGQGVSDETKEHWDRFKFQPHGKGYGSLSHIEGLDKASKSRPESKVLEEEPTCSICLGEYEEGEDLVCLPCKHLYHEDCISSWCSNHIRCPLCNLDLESVSGDTATMTTASSSPSS
jgi:hypothetical protein